MPVVHSFVHSGKDKITSLTMTVSGDKFMITMSDKTNKIRVMLNPDEIAGLSDAIKSKSTWNTFHRFEKEGKVSETKISFNKSFFNLESGGVKIAIKLTDDELSAFHRVLDIVFEKLVLSKV
jgi:hypothetical protein